MSSEKTVTKRQQISSTVYRAIGFLSTDNPQAKEITARCRHSAGLQPGEDPALFGWLLEMIPEELQAQGSGISREEKAIYTALTLYPGGAAHTSEHINLGEAVRKADIKRERLFRVETAKNFDDMETQLRGLLQLLKAKGQPVNYSTLAADLYDWQWDRTQVARSWERAYCAKH